MAADPYRFPDDREALAEGVARMLGELLSEPMKPHELAALFRVPPKTMGAILRNLEDRGRAERVGRRWRVRLTNLPPAYHVAAGLIVPREVR